MSAAVERLQTTLWEAYAHVYDGLLDLFTYRDMLDLVAREADCAGRRVLDVGAGTGNVTRALLASGAAHVTSVDASANMLARARRKLAPDVAAGRVDVVHADAVRAMSQLPDGSMDRITAVNFLYVLEDRAPFFEQAARVLAPGGWLVAAHTTRPGAGPIVRDQYRRGGLAAMVRPRLLGVAVVDAVIDLLAKGGRFDFAPVERIAEDAARAGLGRTRSLGRCYGGDADGVNELLLVAA